MATTNPNTKPMVPFPQVSVVGKTSTTISLRWAKAHDKETPQTRLLYTVTWCVAPYKWDSSRQIGERKYNNDSYVIRGLQPNTTYEIIIYVRDEAGCENTYARTTVTTLANTQPQMANKTVTVVGKTSNSISIRWNKATDQETPGEKLLYTVTWHVAPYKIDNLRKIGERKYDNDNYVITGLEPGTTYDIVIYVRDEHGYENTYARTTVTTVANTAPIVSSRVVTLTGKTSSSLSISWVKAVDKETARDRLVYIVTWYKNNVKVGATRCGTNTCTINGLEPETTYTIEIVVQDEGGLTSSFGKTNFITLSANTQPQIASKTVTAVGKTGDSLTLRWAKATDKETPQGKLVYTVSWSKGKTKVGELKCKDNSCVITGLEPGTTYEVAIIVEDEGGLKSAYAKTAISTIDILAIVEDPVSGQTDGEISQDWNSSCIINTHIISYTDAVNPVSGQTIYGVINNAVWKEYGLKGVPLKSKTRAEAIRILTGSYWFRMRLGEVKSQNISNLLVEWCFVTGDTALVVKELQTLLGLAATGVMDDNTVDTLNKQSSKIFFTKLHKRRREWYEQKMAAEQSEDAKATYDTLIALLETIQYGELTDSETGEKITFHDAPTAKEREECVELRNKYMEKYASLAASESGIEARKADKADELRFDIMFTFLNSYSPYTNITGLPYEDDPDRIALLCWRPFAPYFKSLSVLNLLAEWATKFTSRDAAKDTIVVYILKMLGIGDTSDEGELFDAIGCQSAEDIYERIYKMRKARTLAQVADAQKRGDEGTVAYCNNYLKRLEAIEFGKLTWADGRVVRFTEDGTVTNNYSPALSTTLTAGGPVSGQTIIQAPLFEPVGRYLVSQAGRYGRNSDDIIANKGITLDEWKKLGRDINGDGKIDEADLRIIGEEDAMPILKTKYWDLVLGDKIKDVNIANLLTVSAWCFGGSYGVEWKAELVADVLKKLLGTGGNTMAEYVKAINSSNNTEVLFDEMREAMKHCCHEGAAKGMTTETALARIEGVGYGRLVWDGGKRSLAFDTEGKITGSTDDRVKPHVEILAPFVLSYPVPGAKNNDAKSDEATDVAAFKKECWDAVRADELRSQNIANILTDWYRTCWIVNPDAGRQAIAQTQQLLGVEATGYMDDDTLDAINRRNPEKLFVEIADRQKAQYKKEGRTGWEVKFNALQFGTLTCKDGRTLVFTDDGEIVKDYKGSKPGTGSKTETDSEIVSPDTGSEKQETDSKQEKTDNVPQSDTQTQPDTEIVSPDTGSGKQDADDDEFIF